MSDVIGKPLQIEELKSILQKHFPATESRPGASSPAPAPANATPHGINFETLLAAFEGDEEILDAVLETVVATMPQNFDKLKQAITERDCEQVYFYVHTIKGGMCNVQANDIFASAIQIETLAKSGALEGIDALWDQLQPQFELAMEQIQNRLKRKAA